ncbi:MAG: hypothetical protein J6S13_03410 [Clostridia bacterium]|nr:hypothetical protein [Clostridia bacterium]
MIPSNEPNNSFDVRNSGFFKGLPPFLQESIMQSGAEITNEQELKAAAEQLIRRENF